MRKVPAWLAFLTVLALSTIALADDTAAEIPAKAAEPRNEKDVDKTGRVPLATALVEAKPARLPVYVENWARLAELTRSDPVVLAQADFWASRRWYTLWDLGTVFLLGSGVAAYGTFDRLATDHWTKTTKWSLAGGLSVAIVSLLTAWAIFPDRDDLLTVINQWNLRHPGQPLAP
jgi:hypothetical protein